VKTMFLNFFGKIFPNKFESSNIHNLLQSLWASNWRLVYWFCDMVKLIISIILRNMHTPKLKIEHCTKSFFVTITIPKSSTMMVSFCIHFVWNVAMETIKNLETLEDSEYLHFISQFFFTVGNKQKYKFFYVEWEKIQKE
jgi:hypothetical protein